MHERRISLRSTIDELAQGFPVPLTQEALDARYAEKPEQHAMDLYTLLVPAIGEIVQKATEKPAYPYYLTDFTSFDNHATSRMSDAINRYMLSHPDSDSNPLTVLARRHEHEGAPRKLIQEGSTTSNRFMNEALSRLPYLYKQTHGRASQDPEELVAIAQNNYWFVVMNAKRHIDELTALRDVHKVFSTRSFSNAFASAKLDDANRLFFPEEFLKQLPEQFHQDGPKHAKGGMRNAIGCPALYSGAIHSLWNWNIDGAEKIYSNQIAEERKIIPVFEHMSAD